MNSPVHLARAYSHHEPARSEILALSERTNEGLLHVQGRSQRLEAQIAATSSELHRLQAELRQLEARNVLLETFAVNEARASEVKCVAVQAAKQLTVDSPKITSRVHGMALHSAHCTVGSLLVHSFCTAADEAACSCSTAVAKHMCHSVGPLPPVYQPSKYIIVLPPPAS